MTPDVWFWMMIAGASCAMLGACGAESFHVLAAHELEVYCRRRQWRFAQEQIVNHREPFMLGAQFQRAMGTAWALTAGVIWHLNSMATVQVGLWHWLAMFVVSVLGLLLVNSWIPYAVARLAAVPLVVNTWRWWWLVSLMAKPIIWGSYLTSIILQRLLGAPVEPDDEEEWLEDEIRAIVSEGEVGGLVEADERGMIEAVIELDEKDVSSVMTPRSRLDALEVDTAWDDAVRFVVDTGRTRVPVFHDRLDNIVGILFAKDLLRESQVAADQRRPIPQLLRKPLIVPESKMLDEMLQQFLGARTHMAIVVDEYGGLAGIVTIEDILEEIVGEIVDETDDVEPDEFALREANRAIVAGTTRINRINQSLALNLPEDNDYDTVAGLLMDHLKVVPAVGAALELPGVTVRVLRASRRSVEQVELLLTDAREDNGRPSDHSAV